MRKINLNNEKEFENRKANGENVRASQSKFFWAIEIPLNRHKKQTLEVIEDMHVLEIGCANGYDAIDYSNCAKIYTGF